MKTRVIVENKVESIHEFDIKKSKNKSGEVVYELYYSKNPVWSNSSRGKLIMRCTNTGDDYKFEFSDNFQFGNLDYDEAFFMHVLLKYVYRKNKYGKIKFK